MVSSHFSPSINQAVVTIALAGDHNSEYQKRDIKFDVPEPIVEFLSITELFEELSLIILTINAKHCL